MDLKQKVENHPLVVGITVVATILGVFAAIKTMFFSTTPNSYYNSASGTLNAAGRDVNVYQRSPEKSSDTPEGAREALTRESKAFDDEGLSDAIQEGNLEQIKLYLIGGKSPNDLLSNVPLLCAAISDRAPHFDQMADLFLNWKPDPLNFSKVNARIHIFARIEGIPQTQQNALFTQLAYSSRPGGSQIPSYVTEDAKFLIRKAAKPDEVIAAFEKANQVIAVSEAEALKHGVNQERDAQLLGNRTPKEVIAENTQIDFLKAIGN